ncbi:MAG: hypothetical protein ACPG5W_13485 [Flavobacteriales bacterium]
MNDFLKALMTNAWCALAAVLCLWIALHVVLVRLVSLKETTWTKFQFAWIFIGFFGVVSLIDENQKSFGISELSRVKHSIEYEYNSLERFLTSDILCMKYIDSGIFSREEFLRRQARQDTICEWTKSVKVLVDTAIARGYAKIDTIPPLKIYNPEIEYEYERITEDLNALSQKISRRSILIEQTGNKDFGNFKHSIGVLLLIVAFAIRLTTVSKKVREQKLLQR